MSRVDKKQKYKVIVAGNYSDPGYELIPLEHRKAAKNTARKYAVEEQLRMLDPFVSDPMPKM
jgi:hypothetical protein